MTSVASRGHCPPHIRLKLFRWRFGVLENVLTGDRSKVWCCKDQYCIGTWNVRSMNQGKLEVAKQEMARVNIDILGISKRRWTETGEFNSDDHYIYYSRQESLRRNGVAITVNKRVQNAVKICLQDLLVTCFTTRPPTSSTLSLPYHFPFCFSITSSTFLP